MSDINVNFELSNVVSSFDIQQVNADLSITPIDLNFTTGPLAITVQGTGAYYNKAIMNSPVAYTSGDVLVTIPQNPIQITGGTFASVEYEVTGTTEPGTGGTNAETTIAISGSIPARGTIAEKAYANFTISGTTVSQYNSDATQAYANFSVSGTTSTIVGGSSTKFNIDIPTSANSQTGGSTTVILPAYGQYQQSVTTVSHATDSNANTMANSIQTALSTNRATLNFTQSNYTDPNSTISTSTAYANVSSGLAGWNHNGDYALSIQTTGGNVANIVYTNGTSSPVTIANVYTSAANTVVTSSTGVFADGVWLLPIAVNVNGSITKRVLRSTTTNPTAAGNFTSTAIGSGMPSGTGTPLSKVWHFGTQFYTAAWNAVDNVINLHKSSDGSSWASSTLTSSSNKTLASMCSDGTTIVLVMGSSSGAGSTVYTTTDGTTWDYTVATLPSSGSSNPAVYDICYTGTNVVAVGSSGAVYLRPMASIDSGAFTSITAITGQTLKAVASDGSGRVIAVGTAGRIISSSDHGATWSTVTSPTTSDWTAITYVGNNKYIMNTATSTWIYENRTFRRLTIDTNYIFSGSTISATSTGGTNTTITASTIVGTTSSQTQDSISISDGTNGQVLQLGYGLTAEQVSKDIVQRFSVAGWGITELSSTSFKLTKSQGGLITSGTQMTATYSNGTGSGVGTTAVSRTSSYLGTANTLNPQPQLSITLDTGTLTVDLPYATNLATISDWTSRLSTTSWTFTQSQLGQFKVEHIVTGVVADVSATVTNSPAVTILRNEYSDGTGTTPDTNIPYFQVEFASNSGYNPQVYRLYFDWSSGYDAASIAQFIRTNASVLGATFTGSGTTVVITANSKGPQTQPIITLGGTGSTQWTAASTYVNGTGSSSVFISIDGNTFPIGENLTPQQTIVELLSQFYSDDWTITRSGANQFRLIAIALGSKTEPTVTTTSTTQTLTKTEGSSHSGWVDGTPISAVVPQQTVNLGLIGVTLPGITLVQN